MGTIDLIAIAVIVVGALLGAFGAFRWFWGLVTGLMIACVLVGLAGMLVETAQWSEPAVESVRGSVVVRHLADGCRALVSSVLGKNR